MDINLLNAFYYTSDVITILLNGSGANLVSIKLVSSNFNIFICR